MIKFSSIDQFRAVIRDLRLRHDYKGKTDDGTPEYRHTEPYPKVTFTGTVKLHGTNAAIVRYPGGVTKYQSRENELSIEKDNAGFMAAMIERNVEPLFDLINFREHIAVFGEWCGGNIQRGVAISDLPKMFVVFAYNVDGIWCQPHRCVHYQGIYNILDFPTYEVEIDFNCPELSQNKIIELTQAVEAECPVAKHFGVSGIGEGLVFSAEYLGERFVFKSKGEKHSVTKVRKLASVNVEEIESVNQFIEYAVTENRLMQGVSVLREKGLEISNKTTGDFLRWIVADIHKEEMDTIKKSGIEIKKINTAISQKARMWYLNSIEL
jgi:hypothetical protein